MEIRISYLRNEPEMSFKLIWLLKRWHGRMQQADLHGKLLAIIEDLNYIWHNNRFRTEICLFASSFWKAQKENKTIQSVGSDYCL